MPLWIGLFSAEIEVIFFRAYCFESSDNDDDEEDDAVGAIGVIILSYRGEYYCIFVVSNGEPSLEAY